MTDQQSYPRVHIEPVESAPPDGTAFSDVYTARLLVATEEGAMDSWEDHSAPADDSYFQFRTLATVDGTPVSITVSLQADDMRYQFDRFLEKYPNSIRSEWLPELRSSVYFFAGFHAGTKQGRV